MYTSLVFPRKRQSGEAHRAVLFFCPPVPNGTFGRVYPNHHPSLQPRTYPPVLLCAMAGRVAERGKGELIFRWKDSEGRSSRAQRKIASEASDRFQNAMLCVTPVSRFVYFASLSTKNQERWDRSTRLDFLVLFHLRKKDEKPAVIKEERTRKKRIYP